MSFGDVWDWAKKNPMLAALAVVGIGLLVLWLLGYFSKAPQQASSGSSDLAAYYAANVAQQKYNAEVTVGQQQANVATHALDTQAATQQLAITAQQDVYNQQTGAALQLGTLNSNNALIATNYQTFTEGQTAQSAQVAAMQIASINALGQTIPGNVILTNPQTGQSYLANTAGQLTEIQPPGFGSTGQPQLVQPPPGFAVA